LASAGIAIARIKGSPSGGCAGSSISIQLATEEQKVHAAWCSRARRKRRSGGVMEYWKGVASLPREMSPSGARYFELLSVVPTVFANRRALAHRSF
jgi:hypothetical protein